MYQCFLFITAQNTAWCQEALGLVFSNICSMTLHNTIIGSSTVDEISWFHNQFQKWFQKWGVCNFQSYKVPKFDSTLIAPLWNPFIHNECPVQTLKKNLKKIKVLSASNAGLLIVHNRPDTCSWSKLMHFKFICVIVVGY